MVSHPSHPSHPRHLSHPDRRCQRPAALVASCRIPVSSTQVKILVPGNHLMVGLLGQRDELLRLVEGAFGGARILVRGAITTR